jgi:hypothetical protein
MAKASSAVEDHESVTQPASSCAWVNLIAIQSPVVVQTMPIPQEGEASNRNWRAGAESLRAARTAASEEPDHAEMIANLSLPISKSSGTVIETETEREPTHSSIHTDR